METPAGRSRPLSVAFAGGTNPQRYNVWGRLANRQNPSVVESSEGGRRPFRRVSELVSSGGCFPASDKILLYRKTREKSNTFYEAGAGGAAQAPGTVSAANLTQFLRAALASYMAESALAMSCCGDCAWCGKEATPKEAVRVSARRRPPLKA